MEKLPVFAHRGYSGVKPEGTYEAYDYAIEKGIPQIELDVRTNQDGTLYVIHDDELMRLLNQDLILSELSDEQTRKLTYPNHESLHTLQDLFDRYGKNVHYLVEVKRGISDVPAVQSVLNANRDLYSQIELMAWDLETAKALKEAFPKIPVLLLMENLDLYDQALDAQWLDGMSLDEAITTQKHILDLHQKDKKCYIWTVNEPERMKQLSQWGADILISNFPDVALEHHRNSLVQQKTQQHEQSAAKRFDESDQPADS